ncbi:hypothetical protein B0H16DRAFT_1470120 [Mycena metata]|uniref:Uncharacterized protein n=1 Tax=Mycena metata TaxID=1033252 RepID=A0AAD7HVA1_9AGAR|nr:hypothetical protein B0H16DRAFT_1470120 [Mycena metata]
MKGLVAAVNAGRRKTGERMGERRGGRTPANPNVPPSVSLARGGNGSARAHATTPGKAPRRVVGNFEGESGRIDALYAAAYERTHSFWMHSTALSIFLYAIATVPSPLRRPVVTCVAQMTSLSYLGLMRAKGVLEPFGRNDRTKNVYTQAVDDTEQARKSRGSGSQTGPSLSAFAPQELDSHLLNVARCPLPSASYSRNSGPLPFPACDARRRRYSVLSVDAIQSLGLGLGNTATPSKLRRLSLRSCFGGFPCLTTGSRTWQSLVKPLLRRGLFNRNTYRKRTPASPIAMWKKLDCLLTRSDRPSPDYGTGDGGSTESGFSFQQSSAIDVRSKCQHFRILVIGRVNAGKMTLLKKVCMYCLPACDTNRPFLKADEDFFDTDIRGKVIAIFTKFDGLATRAFQELKGDGYSRSDAQRGKEQRAEQLLTTDFIEPLKSRKVIPSV